eukprot:3461696-Amphidinium_carterae.1
MRHRQYVWLDHSISAWSQSDTQWHLNEFSAITMLNTHSTSRTFRCDEFPQWVRTEQYLMTVRSKYLEADSTIKQQYVMATNGVEHNHNQAMALHHWHRDNHMVLTNQQMAIRLNNAGNGTELQWTSPVTIMHSSVTITLENDGR